MVYSELFTGTLQLQWPILLQYHQQALLLFSDPRLYEQGLSWSSGRWAGRNVSQLLQVLEPYLPISHTLHRLSKLQWFLSHNKRTRAWRSVSLLSAATGRPLTPPLIISIITTQLLQITAARALFVIKLEQRQCEPAAISASNYLLRASCLIDPNWRDRRPRSDRGRRGFFGPQNTPRNRSCGCNGYKRDKQRQQSLKGDKIKAHPGETRYQTETYNHSGKTTFL